MKLGSLAEKGLDLLIDFKRTSSWFSNALYYWRNDMAKWVTEQLEELLQQINEVPYTDDREKCQLTILMNGLAQLNNKAMDNAATKTRSQMRGWSLDDSVKKKAAKKKVDESADELTRLRPIR